MGREESVKGASLVLWGCPAGPRSCFGMDYTSAPWTAALHSLPPLSPVSTWDKISTDRTPNFPEAAPVILPINFFPFLSFFGFTLQLSLLPPGLTGELLNILYTDSHKSVTVVKCSFCAPSESRVVRLMIFFFFFFFF